MRWDKSTNSCVHIQNFSIIVFSLNNFYGYKSSTKLVGFQILAGCEAMVITCLIHAPDKRKSDKRLRKINKKTHNIPMTNISTTFHNYPWHIMTRSVQTSWHVFFSNLNLNSPVVLWTQGQCVIAHHKAQVLKNREAINRANRLHQRALELFVPNTGHTHTKLENKKQHGTIQNQFRCI